MQTLAEITASQSVNRDEEVLMEERRLSRGNGVKSWVIGGWKSTPKVLCEACGKVIYALERAPISRKNLHSQCTRCEECGTLLRAETWRTWNNRMLCKHHYETEKRENPERATYYTPAQLRAYTSGDTTSLDSGSASSNPESQQPQTAKKSDYALSHSVVGHPIGDSPTTKKKKKKEKKEKEDKHTKKEKKHKKEKKQSNGDAISESETSRSSMDTPSSSRSGSPQTDAIKQHATAEPTESPEHKKKKKKHKHRKTKDSTSTDTDSTIVTNTDTDATFVTDTDSTTATNNTAASNAGTDTSSTTAALSSSPSFDSSSVSTEHKKEKKHKKHHTSSTAAPSAECSGSEPSIPSSTEHKKEKKHKKQKKSTEHSNRPPPHTHSQDLSAELSNTHPMQHSNEESHSTKSDSKSDSTKAQANQRQSIQHSKQPATQRHSKELINEDSNDYLNPSVQDLSKLHSKQAQSSQHSKQPATQRHSKEHINEGSDDYLNPSVQDLSKLHSKQAQPSQHSKQPAIQHSTEPATQRHSAHFNEDSDDYLNPSVQDLSKLHSTQRHSAHFNEDSDDYLNPSVQDLSKLHSTNGSARTATATASNLTAEQLSQALAAAADDPSSTAPPSPVSMPGVMFEPPTEQHEKIGWMGTMPRTVAEEKLAECALGMFLLRWSPTVQSYVLSYKAARDHIEHIAEIRPMRGGVSVKRDDGTLHFFPSLVHYVNEMRRLHVITEPLPTFIYNLTPSLKRVDK